jgi:hypothetical protein
MKHSKIVIPIAAAALVAAVTLSASARQEPPDAKRPAKAAPVAARAGEPQDDKVVIQTQRWSYPLATCPISGEKLGAKPTEFVVEGRMVRTCCGDCKAEIVKSPAAAIKKIDAAVVAEQKAGYPLTTCAVTDAKLDDKAVDYVWGTRLVRLANADAVKAFQKDPKTAMAKVDAAYVKAQTAAYPLQTCVVTGEKLGGMGAPYDRLYGTTLVRFCCSGCTADFEKDPQTYMKKIADAKKPAK